jgi:methylglutaconyl-CoA hydratase
MNFKTLIVDIDDRGVAAVILNRPDVHNAFNKTVIGELTTAFNDLGSNKTVRAITITGAGKSFSAGADLNWMKEAANFSEEENMADAMALSTMLKTINFCPKPVIALVNGAAFGGGVGLVSVADIAFATRGAKFCLSEVRLGLTPATISPYVVAAMGERNARRYFITAERFDALTAHKIGFIHEVFVDSDALQIGLKDLLDNILVGGPEAVSEAKDLIFAVKNKPITDEIMMDTASRIAKRRISAEGQEGLSSFFDKRKANWIKNND